MSKEFVQFIAPLFAVFVALSGVVAVGQQSRNYLHHQDPYHLAFRDIDCPTPEGMTRDEFLGEVQYMAAWPDDVRVLEDHLAARLQKAFASHPWVEMVRRVEVTPDRRVRVELTFRTPFLAVPTRGKGNGSENVVNRSVDAYGILLPHTTADASLQPALLSEVQPPPTRAGKVWDDARVRTVVRTAVFLRPYYDQLGIERYEFNGDDLIVQARQGRVVWGRAPGDERPEEASAVAKLQRLLDPPVAQPDRRERDVRFLIETDTRVVQAK